MCKTGSLASIDAKGKISTKADSGPLPIQNKRSGITSNSSSVATCKGILKGTSLFHIMAHGKPCKFRKKQSPTK